VRRAGRGRDFAQTLRDKDRDTDGRSAGTQDVPVVSGRKLAERTFLPAVQRPVIPGECGEGHGETEKADGVHRAGSRLSVKRLVEPGAYSCPLVMF
jgi:hypothetical protein